MGSCIKVVKQKKLVSYSCSRPKPKRPLLTLFWEFVLVFQLSTSFHYSTPKQNVSGPKNKNSGHKKIKKNTLVLLSVSWFVTIEGVKV
jgi:hypothetical protein